MLEVSCPRCKGTHELEVTWTKDSSGRARIRYQCPAKGTMVSSFPPRGASKPKEAKVAARKTTKTGSTPASLRVSIPMVVDSDPDIAAAWDIAEGIIDGLQLLSGQEGAGSLQRQAAAAYARAKGDSSEADTTEHAFGRALAEALRLVVVHRGMSSSDWAALAPRGLGSGGSGALGSLSLPGLDLGEGLGSTAAGALGAVGGSLIGVPPQLGAAAGGTAWNVFENWMVGQE